MVIDADAINILSLNKLWLTEVPADSILTPHPKEFERLTGKSENSFERLENQKKLSQNFGIFIVLKGAHTSITTPEGLCFFNSTGNPGMARGGIGDVLTGMIVSLVAQGYTSLQSCILGVYLHGLAGDIARNKLSEYSMTASDLIKKIPDAFQKILS